MKSDTTRMVIGFVLVVVILLGWQLLFRPKPRPQPEPAAAPEQAAPAEKVTPAAEVESLPVHRPALAAAEAVPETVVVLENAQLRLEFSSVGGVLRSCRLKRFNADMVPPGGSLLGTDVLLASGNVSTVASPMRVVATETTATFTLRSDSLVLTKTFRLLSDYGLDYSVKVEGPAAGTVTLADSGIALTEKNLKEALAHYHFYSHVGRKLQQIHSSRLKKGRAQAENPDWVGLKSKYFLLALISRDGAFDSTFAVALYGGRVGMGAAVYKPAASMTVYLGPIEYDRLRSYGLGLEGVAGLGWTRPLALAMLWFLRLLHTIVRNWGVAIIVFSVIMKLAFYPLTRTQTRQMRQMQLLQPKLNELKAKHKNDPQKMNQETMQLYRLYKINPMSGCLPLLVQLPIFWALYAVLRNSIELRGAALGLWISDLSEPDVLFGHLPHGLPLVGGSAFGLLPVLMGVSFIAQNLMTSADKRNWALTVIFPIFITAIFLNMPSGLQLYWFIYNVLSIGETMIGLKGGGLWTRRTTRAESPTAG